MYALPIQPKSVFCIGAHADDIEIGCGGLLLKWIAANPGLKVTWVVASAAGSRRAEAKQSAKAFLADAVESEVFVEDFRDAYFPAQWEEIKNRVVEIGKGREPDVVLTHRLEDRHQDHRVLAELAWNIFRDHIVLEYEIPKFEGDLATPNFYVPLTEAEAHKKVELLNTYFPTQSSKDWFSNSTFLALMRIRGLECRSASGLAEGFHARKLVC